MIHFRRFRSDVPAPLPAQEAYVRRPGGRGWPEQCPPVRAANAYGFDLLVALDLVFARTDDGGWRLEQGGALEADWAYEDPQTPDAAAAAPLVQEAAWFWDRGQTLPHPISDDVWPLLRDQVKVSTFLFLASDPNELLWFMDVPHRPQAYRVLPALVEADWYPASYPWHCVLELDRRHERIELRRGDPLCRIVPVPRTAQFLCEMDDEAFGAYFDRSQAWLAAHGRPAGADLMDLGGAYARNQAKSTFRVRL